MKSWSIARALIFIAHTAQRKLLIGCFRELQVSINDSVHRLLVKQIELMGLRSKFLITKTSIRSLSNGSEFIFKGIRANPTEIKSMEGLNLVWVEEGQLVSKESWETLIPTVRDEGWIDGTHSEIWVSFNPNEELDDTWQRFIVKRAPNSLVIKVGWEHNPWLPASLEMERTYMLATDPEAYDNVWGGQPKQISDAVIFNRRYVIEAFEPPENTIFYRGLDFGFSTDPMACMSLYTTGTFPEEHLWIHEEVYGHGIEIDEYATFLDNGIKDVRMWPMKADSSRPESISYLKRVGFPIQAAEKWQGSVEDGIAHLKAFKQIHIHQQCVHQQQEARWYKWKVDKAGNILPIIIDANNHCWDADRYALDGFIRRRGAAARWARLAGLQ